MPFLIIPHHVAAYSGTPYNVMSYDTMLCNVIPCYTMPYYAMPCTMLCNTILIHSFIHSGHFYSAPSSPLLLRGAPDYSTDTVSEFHAEAHRQLQVKDLPKVP